LGLGERLNATIFATHLLHATSVETQHSHSEVSNAKVREDEVPATFSPKQTSRKVAQRVVTGAVPFFSEHFYVNILSQ
jgi:hypothetical protein